MRTLGQLLICALLAVPSAHAAFGPWDLDIDGAAEVVRTVHHHIATSSDQLARYVEVPSAQLRAVAELPLMREVTRELGLWEVGRLLALAAADQSRRPCQHRG